MEIRMLIDDSLMEELKESLGLKTNVDIINNALTILNWATKEMEKERVILSAQEDGKNVQTLIMPALEMAKYMRKRKPK
jgi:hypothetical protein